GMAALGLLGGAQPGEAGRTAAGAHGGHGTAGGHPADRPVFLPRPPARRDRLLSGGGGAGLREHHVHRRHPDDGGVEPARRGHREQHADEDPGQRPGRGAVRRHAELPDGALPGARGAAGARVAGQHPGPAGRCGPACPRAGRRRAGAGARRPGREPALGVLGRRADGPADAAGRLAHPRAAARRRGIV
ncbi:MAG: hypothetical protein AVDCRST_MAG89-2622, partial [uncultured Gemmatimonadetes bacterium]